MTPGLLVSHLPLQDAVQEVGETGAAFVTRVLTEPFRRALLREVEAETFARLDERVGPYGVHQQADQLALTGAEIADHPAVHRLCRDFTAAAGELRGWYPNDVSIQRYQPGSVGITPHLDGKRYRLLVAIFTLEGSAPLAICTDRDGTVQTEWQTVPGSLLLLRGPGLGGIEDGRPLHAVRGPDSGQRTSLTLRFDSRTGSRST